MKAGITTRPAALISSAFLASAMFSMRRVGPTSSMMPLRISERAIGNQSETVDFVAPGGATLLVQRDQLARAADQHPVILVSFFVFWN